MRSFSYFIFAFILYAACGAVVFKLKRRKYFWWKLIGSSVAYFLFAFLWSYFRWRLRIGWFNFIFLIFDCMCMLIILLCFKTNLPCAAFYATVGYTIEHISSRILWLLTAALSLKVQGQLWVRLVAGIVVILIVYFLFIRKEHKRMSDGGFLLPKKTTIIVSVLSIMFIYVFSMYADSLVRETNTVLTNMATLGLGVLLFIIQSGIFSRSRIEEEKNIVRRAMTEQAEQYKLSKENIDLINIKCHDLKHRIDSLKNSDNKDREEQIEELEKLLKTYEAGFKTENNALDAVLTKKALQCNDLKIKLLPVIDGGAVSVLKDEDVYSLFGNILDNAIEYLSTVEDESLREISLKITCRNKLLIIHTENYCSTPIKFKGELPVTTKPDKHNHGFGMASIKYIVGKYGGTLSVKQEDDNFILNIIIPA